MGLGGEGQAVGPGCSSRGRNIVCQLISPTKLSSSTLFLYFLSWFSLDNSRLLLKCNKKTSRGLQHNHYIWTKLNKCWQLVNIFIFFLYLFKCVLKNEAILCSTLTTNTLDSYLCKHNSLPTEQWVCIVSFTVVLYIIFSKLGTFFQCTSNCILSTCPP